MKKIIQKLAEIQVDKLNASILMMRGDGSGSIPHAQGAGPFQRYMDGFIDSCKRDGVDLVAYHSFLTALLTKVAGEFPSLVCKNKIWASVFQDIPLLDKMRTENYEYHHGQKDTHDLFQWIDSSDNVNSILSNYLYYLNKISISGNDKLKIYKSIASELPLILDLVFAIETIYTAEERLSSTQYAEDMINLQAYLRDYLSSDSVYIPLIGAEFDRVPRFVDDAMSLFFDIHHRADDSLLLLSKQVEINKKMFQDEMISRVAANKPNKKRGSIIDVKEVLLLLSYGGFFVDGLHGRIFENDGSLQDDSVMKSMPLCADMRSVLNDMSIKRFNQLGIDRTKSDIGHELESSAFYPLLIQIAPYHMFASKLTLVQEVLRKTIRNKLREMSDILDDSSVTLKTRITVDQIDFISNMNAQILDLCRDFLYRVDGDTSSHVCSPGFSESFMRLLDVVTNLVDLTRKVIQVDHHYRAKQKIENLAAMADLRPVIFQQLHDYLQSALRMLPEALIGSQDVSQGIDALKAHVIDNLEADVKLVHNQHAAKLPLMNLFELFKKPAIQTTMNASHPELTSQLWQMIQDAQNPLMKVPPRSASAADLSRKTVSDEELNTRSEVSLEKRMAEASALSQISGLFDKVSEPSSDSSSISNSDSNSDSSSLGGDQKIKVSEDSETPIKLTGQARPPKPLQPPPPPPRQSSPQTSSGDDESVKSLDKDSNQEVKKPIQANHGQVSPTQHRNGAGSATEVCGIPSSSLITVFDEMMSKRRSVIKLDSESGSESESGLSQTLISNPDTQTGIGDGYDGGVFM